MRSDMPPAIDRSHDLPTSYVPASRAPEPVASGQLDFLVHQAMVLASGAGAVIALEQDDEIVCRARSGSAAPGLGAVLNRHSGLSGQCATAGEALVCTDTDSDPRVNAAVCEALGVRSIAVLPIKKSGQVIGILEVLAREPEALGAATVAKLEPIAESIAAVADYPESESSLEHETVSSEAEPPLERAATTAQTPALTQPAPAHVLETFLAEIQGDSRFRWSRMATVALIASIALLLVIFAGRAVMHRPAAATGIAATGLSPEQLRRAAELGDSAAQYALGIALQTGDGMKQDAASGARWLELAAKHGDPDAQYEFANALMEGKGVRRDTVEACAWYTVAAFSGKPVSEALLSSFGEKLSKQELARVRYRLGQMFSTGIGVPQDNVAAYAWFALSEAAGYAPAQRDKAALASEMNRQQIAEAKERAAEWLESERTHDSATAQSR